MKYNTGNPVGPDGSIDFRDLHDNAGNADLMLNSLEPSWTDRLGRERATVKAMEDATPEAIAARDAAQVAQAGAEVAMDAALAGSNVYATEALGRAAVLDGQTFNVQGTGDIAVTVYRRTSSTTSVVVTTLASSTAITRLNSLLINSGKPFPFRQLTRGAITSPANNVWSNLILDVKVMGAKKGEYYQIAYQQNEATIGGTTWFGWIIKAFNKSDFLAGIGDGTLLVTYTHIQEQLVRDGTIQTVQILPPSHPGMSFYITVDTSKLPTAGTPVSSNISGQAGWSWIIDPSQYRYDDPTVLRNTTTDGQNINKGRPFPNRQMDRNGVTSNSNSFLANAVLGVVVSGAAEGKYYGIRYFKNGSTAIAGPPDGWWIDEQDAATYSTDSTATRVVDYIHDAPNIPRGGIQTVVVKSTVREGLSFQITLDTDALPAYGTFVAMNVSGNPGWSWIIDPQNYRYGSNLVYGGMAYSIDATGKIYITWHSGDSQFRLRFGPNGFNSLPNVISIETRGLLETGWTSLAFGLTDWLPPLVVQAVNNGDGRGAIYTGGNHGTDGSAGGSQTARNIGCQIFVDDAALEIGVVKSGSANKIGILVENDLMAYNTTGLVNPTTFPARYPVTQTFFMDIVAGSMEVLADVKAKEAVIVSTDNGVQCLSMGFQGSLIFVGGQYESRQAFSSLLNSGPKSGYPNAWALVLQSEDDKHQQVTWTDREYEAGDGRYVSASAPYIRGGGEGNTKMYHAIVASQPTTLSMNEGYKWRGGYSWQLVANKSVGADSLFAFRKDGRTNVCSVKTGAIYTRLP